MLLIGIILFRLGMKETALRSVEVMAQKKGISMEFVESDFQNAKEISPVIYIGTYFIFMLDDSLRKVVANENIFSCRCLCKEGFYHLNCAFYKCQSGNK